MDDDIHMRALKIWDLDSAFTDTQASGVFLYIGCILSTTEKLKPIGKLMQRLGIKGNVRTSTKIYIFQ